MKREWSALITSAGHLPGQVHRQFDDVIRGLAGKQVTLSIEVYNKRSDKQNRFYQGPFIKTIERKLLQFDKRVHHDDIHDGLKDKYAKNGFSLWMPDGSEWKIPPSTRRMEKPEFEDYLQEIRADFAQRFRWELPLPGEDLMPPIAAY